MNRHHMTHHPDAIRLADPMWVWEQFAQHLGPEALLACYGWKFPPLQTRPGETVWFYRDGGALVGWGSIVKDPTTAVFWHASGVFPAYQGRGYREAIRRHLCTEAFARGAEAVSLVVLDTNPQHLERCHREAVAGSPWQPSGRIWRPAPGQTIFTLLREDAPLVTGIRRECSDLHESASAPALREG